MENKMRTQVMAALLVMAGGTAAVYGEMSVQQEIEVGVQSVDINNNEAKFEEYREVPNGLVIEKYSVQGMSDSVDYSLDLNKLMQEDQSAFLDMDLGLLSIDALYDQTPHNYSNWAKTLYQETSPGVFVLPDGLQGTLQGQSVNNWFNIMNSTFIGLANDQSLKTRTDTAGVNLGMGLSDALSLGLGFNQTKKHGNQLKAFGLSRSHIVELPTPVDQTVYDSSIGLDYKTAGLTMGLSYGLNIFQNDVQTIMWDNSRRLTDQSGSQGAAAGRASLAPDNVAHNGQFSLGFQLPLKSRLAADITYTRMLQDEDMMPYTSNSALPFPSALPSETVDADQTLVVQNYHLSNRGLKRFDVGIKVRAEQLGNDSKEISFSSHSLLDNSMSDPQETVHYTYHKLNLSAYADWRLLRALTLGVEGKRENAVRTHREYRETEETGVNGTLRFRPASWFAFNGKYLWSDRVGEDYQTEHYDHNGDGIFDEIPAVRRYDIGPRTRNAGEATMDLMGKALTVSLNGGLGYDQYRTGEGLNNDGLSTHTYQLYGLLEQRDWRAGLNVSLDVSEDVSLNGYYQMEQVQGLQRSNYSNPTPNQDFPSDWSLLTNDRYDVLGFNLNLSPARKIGIDLGYDLSYAEGTYDYQDVGSANGGTGNVPVNPPNTKTSKQDYSAECHYKAKDNVTFTLGYLFERYDVSDFAKDIAPLTSGQAANQTNLLLGDYISDYKAHILSFMVKYKW